MKRLSLLGIFTYLLSKLLITGSGCVLGLMSIPPSSLGILYCTCWRTLVGGPVAHSRFEISYKQGLTNTISASSVWRGLIIQRSSCPSWVTEFSGTLRPAFSKTWVKKYCTSIKKSCIKKSNICKKVLCKKVQYKKVPV